MKQRDTFISEEGDNWFERNHDNLLKKNYSSDPVINILEKINAIDNKNLKVLEIGCGEGRRLSYINSNFNFHVTGIDPSSKAVAAAGEDGIHCHLGTADRLPFTDKSFDIIIFGFCLYVCDQEDLFKIAYEANRVLKDQGWIIIHDFHSDYSYKYEYHHNNKIKTHKMDFRNLFLWHPYYTCYHHEVFHHTNMEFTDNLSEWTAISTLRKFDNEQK